MADNFILLIKNSSSAHVELLRDHAEDFSPL